MWILSDLKIKQLLREKKDIRQICKRLTSMLCGSWKICCICSIIVIVFGVFEILSRNKASWDFPGGPVVKTSPPSAGGAGLIPGWGAKIQHASGPQNKTIKQKQHCDKFNILKIVKKKKIPFQNYLGSLRHVCPCSEPAPGLLRLVRWRNKPEEFCRWWCWCNWKPCSRLLTVLV